MGVNSSLSGEGKISSSTISLPSSVISPSGLSLIISLGALSSNIGATSSVGGATSSTTSSAVSVLTSDGLSSGAGAGADASTPSSADPTLTGTNPPTVETDISRDTTVSTTNHLSPPL